MILVPQIYLKAELTDKIKLFSKSNFSMEPTKTLSNQY